MGYMFFVLFDFLLFLVLCYHTVSELHLFKYWNFRSFLGVTPLNTHTLLDIVYENYDSRPMPWQNCYCTALCCVLVKFSSLRDIVFVYFVVLQYLVSSFFVWDNCPSFPAFIVLSHTASAVHLF